jgi:hypothetical protein
MSGVPPRLEITFFQLRGDILCRRPRQSQSIPVITACREGIRHLPQFPPPLIWEEYGTLVPKTTCGFRPVPVPSQEIARRPNLRRSVLNTKGRFSSENRCSSVQGFAPFRTGASGRGGDIGTVRIEKEAGRRQKTGGLKGLGNKLAGGDGRGKLGGGQNGNRSAVRRFGCSAGLKSLAEGRRLAPRREPPILAPGRQPRKSGLRAGAGWAAGAASSG